MSWTPADQHRPQREAHAVAAAIAADEDVDRLLAANGAGMHRTLELMRTWADTGVRANHTDTGGADLPIWCEAHQRDRRRCPVPELCPGHPYRPGADPVGELAADHHDQAATDHADLLRLLTLRASIDRRIAHHATTYTRRRNGTDGTPGSAFCASCFRWRSTLVDIDLRADGKARFPGLCRRCGEFRSAYRRLPPLVVLEAWHTPGKRATRELIESALQPQSARSGKSVL